MKDQYVKDIENQNYDLMKRLAEVEEILEDYDQKLKHNNKVSRSLIINLIKEMWYKVDFLHKYKLLLEENDIPHDYNDFTLQQQSYGQEVADKYLDAFLDSWQGRIDDLYETKAFDMFKKFIEPYLLDDETDGEEDGDF